MINSIGSESSTMIVIDVNSKQVYKDRVALVFGGATWLKGGDAFIYGKTNPDDVHDLSRYIDTKVYHHKKNLPN